MPLRVGTSGWQYRHWRTRFYPAKVAQGRWLEFYAERFATVEVNATFYRLPRPEVVARWAGRTPADFVLAVKASRYLTHVRRLRDPAESVARFVEVVMRPLGGKLGPVLLQLPPTLRADPALLADALDAFPAGLRRSVEVRHPSWFTDEVAAVLAARDVPLCLSDRRGRPQEPLWHTADWGYVRLHEGRAQPWPCYGRAALVRWVERVAGLWPPGSDVFVFFNNDPMGCALRDAAHFAAAARRVGLCPTRTVAAEEVVVGPA